MKIPDHKFAPKKYEVLWYSSKETALQCSMRFTRKKYCNTNNAMSEIKTEQHNYRDRKFIQKKLVRRTQTDK